MRKWIKPIPLIEAIGGCLRVVCDKFCGTDAVDATSYIPCGRGGAISISIPLDSIKRESEVFAGAGKVAGKSIVSGMYKQGWRVKNLPKNLILIGKAPDSSECAIAGVDFDEDEIGYLFKRQPSAFGTINTVNGKPTISFYCLCGTPTVPDYPQFSYTTYHTKTADSYRTVDHVKSRYPVVNGACGQLTTAACGLYSCELPGTLRHVWEEGDYKIGVVSNSLLYAKKTAKTKSIGSLVTFGDTLLDPVAGDGVISISDGVASWCSGVRTSEHGIKTTTETVMEYSCFDAPLQSFVDDYRADIAASTIAQKVEGDMDVVCPTDDAEYPVIVKAWVLYANKTPSDSGVYYGISPQSIRQRGIKNGGCLECSNIQISIDSDGHGCLIAVTLGAKVHGSPQKHGDCVYAICLEDDNGKIYKSITPSKKTPLCAQATIVVQLKTKASIGVSGPIDDVSDDLSKYYLAVEQDIKLDDWKASAASEIN